MDASDWIAGASALIALGALWASVVANRSADEAERIANGARDQAANALSRAADALQQSATADNRSADALDQVTAALQRLKRSPRVEWNLAVAEGEGYVLTNQGELDARNVSIHLSDGRIFDLQAPLRPGDSEVLVLSGSLAYSPSSITITWVDDNNPSNFSQRALPPRV